MTVRALAADRFGEPWDVLHERDIASVPPTGREVRIAVEFAGLNFLDVALCRGDYPTRPQPPFVPGVECVGTVTDAGPEVSTPVGARVLACPVLHGVSARHGAIADEVTVDEALTVQVAAGLVGAEVTALPVTYQTAWFALDRARLAAGETVLVHAAAGGVGTATIQLALRRGARVIAVAGGRAKTELCAQLGAQIVVDRHEEDFAAVVDEVTSGAGVDVVVDPVGGATFEKSLTCMGFEARIVPVGAASGGPAFVDPLALTARNIDVVGVSWGSAYPWRQPERVRFAYDELLRLLAAGQLRPVIDRTVGFADVPHALRDLASGATTGKIIVSVAEGGSAP